jgi:hypothetical protein
MEITSWQIYWITRLDAISSVTSFIGALAAVFGCAGVIASFVENIDELKKPFSLLLGVGIFFGIIGLACPTSKQMAAIIVIPRLVNAVQGNKELMQLPDNLVGLANGWIDELKPKESKSRSGQ